MCPKGEYVKNKLDRVLESIQIQSAANIEFYGFIW